MVVGRRWRSRGDATEETAPMRESRRRADRGESRDRRLHGWGLVPMSGTHLNTTSLSFLLPPVLFSLSREMKVKKLPIGLLERALPPIEIKRKARRCVGDIVGLGLGVPIAGPAPALLSRSGFSNTFNFR